MHNALYSCESTDCEGFLGDLHLGHVDTGAAVGLIVSRRGAKCDRHKHEPGVHDAHPYCPGYLTMNLPVMPRISSP